MAFSRVWTNHMYFLRLKRSLSLPSAAEKMKKSKWIVTERIGIKCDCIEALCIDGSGTIFFVIAPSHDLMSLKPSDQQPSVILSFDSAITGMTCIGNKLYICEGKKFIIGEYDILKNDYTIIAGNGERRYSKHQNLGVATFFKPTKLATDQNGNLYVSDMSEICKINLFAGTASAIKYNQTNQQKIQCAEGLFVCNDGSILACDSYRNSVVHIKDGIPTIVMKSFGLAPTDVYLQSDNSLIVGGSGKLVLVKNNLITTIHAQRFTKYNFVVDKKDKAFYVYDKEIMKIEDAWKWERFLWIGRLKEDASYCRLVTLPTDIVKVIANMILWIDS